MQPHILIVEDDDIQQSVLRSVLETRGVEVDVVSDGPGAVTRIRDNTYDLVLLDYLLPEIDGLTIRNPLLDGPG